jgi:pilus assembly protein FimV
VRLTIQAGCETSIRREYTLFMDPPAIQPPVVAADSTARAEVAPPPRPAPRAADRARGAGARAGGAGDAGAGVRKPAPARSRAAAKTAAKRPPPAPAERPRLTVSSAPPASAGTQAATAAENEKAQQELANSIEAETVVLRQRIVELTAMVERMQAEVRAQEVAQREAEEAAKAPPPAPEPDWWEANALLLAVIVGVPLVIAAVLLWRRRRDATTDVPRRLARTSAPRAPGAPEAPAPVLRNAPAGLLNPGPEAAPVPTAIKLEKVKAHRPATSELAVSELSQVTEEARVYIALGHPDRAIEVLHEHIRHLPRSLPAAWLMLLDLYYAGGRRQDFRRLAEEFHLRFNVQTPSWEGFAPGDPENGGLELYPHIIRQVTELWRKPECHAYLERLLYDNREGRRTGFPLAAYADILLLLQMLEASMAVDIDSELVQDGRLDRAPGAPEAPPAPTPRTQATAAAPRARKPMPPDPAAAARPVQQPIRFELDPDTAARDSGKKPRS